MILDTVIKLKAHPTIEEVYGEIQKIYPSISKTTVYRNLRQLAQSNLIRQVSLPDGLERYEALIKKHYHFKCKNCASLFDIELEYLASIDDRVQGMYGFQVDEHDLLFSGVCQNCKQKKP